MAEKGQNFSMWAGDYKEITFVIQHTTDLTGYEAKWAMARAAVDTPILTKHSTDAEITLLGDEVSVTLLSADTASLTKGRYYHELEIEDLSGDVATYAVGKIRIHPKLI